MTEKWTADSTSVVSMSHGRVAQCFVSHNTGHTTVADAKITAAQIAREHNAYDVLLVAAHMASEWIHSGYDGEAADILDGLDTAIAAATEQED